MSGEDVNTIPDSDEELNENTVVEPPTKKRKSNKGKGKQKSEVWNHFSRETDPNTGKRMATCLHCNTVYAADSSQNGTSTLRRHLKKCEKHPEKTKNQSNIYVKKDKEGEEAVVSGKVTSWRFIQADVRKSLVHMIIEDELPFSFVEKDGYKKHMEAACPMFNIPSRHTIARDVEDMFKSEKKQLRDYLKKSKQRISLTTDTWTSIQNVNYMCVTAHYIDEDWQLQKKIISFKQITSHKGDDIGAAILGELIEWGIEDSIMTITLDNASANDTAVEFVKERLKKQLISSGEYLHMRCAAHILNLVVKDGMKEYNNSVERIRSAIKYIKKSPTRFKLFKDCVKKANIQSKAMLRLDCPTRWNSTCDMLKVAATLSDAFPGYELVDRSYRKDVVNAPYEVDFENVRTLTALLEQFKIKTEKFSGTSYVTANIFFSEVVDLNAKLIELDGEPGANFRLMGQRMREKFNKYWDGSGGIKSINMVMYFAAILDPQLKMDIISYGFEEIYTWERDPKMDDRTFKDHLASKVREKVKEIKKELEKVFQEYCDMYKPKSTNDKSGAESSSSSVVSSDNSFVNRFNKRARGSVSIETRTELETYLDEPRLQTSESFEILNWWKVNSPRLPILSKMAKDFLAIQISSVASESTFSTSGRVLDAFRSSLAATKVEELICVQDWQRGFKKRTYLEDEFDEYDYVDTTNGDSDKAGGASTSTTS